MNDLTVSNIERQNVLNNRYAVEDLQENLGFTGMLFEGEYRFTKKMVAEFYEVEERTVERLLEEHGDELKYNGYILSRGKQLKEFKLQFAPVINVGSKTFIALSEFCRTAIIYILFLGTISTPWQIKVSTPFFSAYSHATGTRHSQQKLRLEKDEIRQSLHLQS